MDILHWAGILRKLIGSIQGKFKVLELEFVY